MDGELLSDTFVELADTMVADFDVIDFLHTLTERSVQLLDASAAGSWRSSSSTVTASAKTSALPSCSELSGPGWRR